MYRNCIYCAGDLGSNEALERFPVGRSVAYDGERGRLWAVCPKCARWNLAPLEERWEAIEDAERLFRDARVRAQRENIGLAKLPDGTRLIGIGRVLPAEMAVVRYGPAYRRRHAASMAAAVGIGTAGTLGAIVYGPGLLLSLPVLPFVAGYVGLQWALSHPDRALRLWEKVQDRARRTSGRVMSVADRRVVAWISGPTPADRILLTRGGLRGARLAPGENGGLAVQLPAMDLRLEGWAAHSLTARRLIRLNRAGGDEKDLAASVRMISTLGGTAGYVERAGRQGLEIGPGAAHYGIQALALEMALHEETERRALEGELAMLEAMWRNAEQIAAIADRLPDELSATESPRIGAAR